MAQTPENPYLSEFIQGKTEWVVNSAVKPLKAHYNDFKVTINFYLTLFCHDDIFTQNWLRLIKVYAGH